MSVGVETRTEIWPHLDCMGEIALNLIMNCTAKEDSFRDLQLATFAVWQLAKMTKEFRTNYFKRWDGEPAKRPAPLQDD
jgi:hypothetical protein